MIKILDTDTWYCSREI